MKKFIIIACAVVAVAVVLYVGFFHMGWYIGLQNSDEADVFITTEGKEFRIRQEDGSFAPFEIRGVDLGSGKPGAWSVDYKIDKATYKRWFGYIQDMGANTIRIYTIHHSDFYEAFYEYNTRREEEGKQPLYLLNGVWVNDYVYNSHSSAYDPEFLETLENDCRTLVDVLHGNLTLSLGYQGIGSGSYQRNVSRWVLGYILGVEWESSLVIYTDQVCEDQSSYHGEYLTTAEGSSPFEAMLARVGDGLIGYETERYGEQRLVAFSNWPNTDPFSYPLTVTYARSKTTCVDVEKILPTENYHSGMFASYHVYPYFPDYLDIVKESEKIPEEEILLHYGQLRKEVIEYRKSLLDAPSVLDYVEESDYVDRQGRYNTYRAYLSALARYHSVPVVISEYGVTTGRGMAREDPNTHRNQGHMTEEEQGQAIVECYEDIMDAGCAGSCLFSWQDEWFKRTWNTMYAIDRDYTAYWSDLQTNEQFFGVFTFDPGKEKSVCYTDGDVSEWSDADLVSEENGVLLSVKYDERALYFLIRKENFDENADTLYIPIDTNPKIGSTYCENYDVSFERPADFLMVIDGRENSRVVVQERYEVLMSTYHQELYAFNPYYDENTPAANSPLFKPINMALNAVQLLPQLPSEEDVPTGISYETGLLRYGNGDPESPDFDSLADFMFAGDYIEVRVPWQLLNFSNPSDMMIHDDYYECYGIENLHINEMYVGAGAEENGDLRIPMERFALKGWGKNVTYHERFKKSYYILKEYWGSLG